MLYYVRVMSSDYVTYCGPNVTTKLLTLYLFQNQSNTSAATGRQRRRSTSRRSTKLGGVRLYWGNSSCGEGIIPTPEHFRKTKFYTRATWDLRINSLWFGGPQTRQGPHRKSDWEKWNPCQVSTITVGKIFLLHLKYSIYFGTQLL